MRFRPEMSGDPSSADACVPRVCRMRRPRGGFGVRLHCGNVSTARTPEGASRSAEIAENRMSSEHGWMEGRGAVASDTCLGRVLAVEGSEARIGLAFPLPNGPDRPTVGKFVAIKGHGTTLVGHDLRGLPAAEESTARGRWPGSTSWARSSARRTGVSRFRRGVREYAAIGDPVEMIGREELNLIYASSERPRDHRRPPQPGPVDPGLRRHRPHARQALRRRRLDRRRQVQRGRRRSSSKMIEVRPELRVLLLDVHNEYRAAFGDRASVIGAENLRLPFWLFNFEEIAERHLRRQARRARGGRDPRRADPDRQGEVPGRPRPSRVERRQATRHGGFTADTPVALPPAGPARR